MAIRTMDGMSVVSYCDALVYWHVKHGTNLHVGRLSHASEAV
jgi:hypothetical protein